MILHAGSQCWQIERRRAKGDPLLPVTNGRIRGIFSAVAMPQIGLQYSSDREVLPPQAEDTA